MSALVLLHPVFSLGNVLMTDGVKALPLDVVEWMLELHQTGDFGEVPEWQVRENWNNILKKRRGSVNSAYLTASSEMVWIRTYLKEGRTAVWLF